MRSIKTRLFEFRNDNYLEIVRIRTIFTVLYSGTLLDCITQTKITEEHWLIAKCLNSLTGFAFFEGLKDSILLHIFITVLKRFPVCPLFARPL